MSLASEVCRLTEATDANFIQKMNETKYAILQPLCDLRLTSAPIRSNDGSLGHMLSWIARGISERLIELAKNIFGFLSSKRMWGIIIVRSVLGGTDADHSAFQAAKEEP